MRERFSTISPERRHKLHEYMSSMEPAEREAFRNKLHEMNPEERKKLLDDITGSDKKKTGD